MHVQHLFATTQLTFYWLVDSGHPCLPSSHLLRPSPTRAPRDSHVTQEPDLDLRAAAAADVCLRHHWNAFVRK